jgi:L-aspartate oxidase
VHQRDIVIIGAGLAGLSTALRLSPHPVTVLTGDKAGEGGASAWAQGGIAAALSEEDAPSLHAEDTVAAGAGLVDIARARMLAEKAPGQIAWLEKIGVAFDTQDGALALGREAAHSRRRIVHAGGDSTGAAVMRALVQAAKQTPSIQALFGAKALKLEVKDGRVIGVHILLKNKLEFIPASKVVLATGGIGQLYSHTTNPPSACGEGLALAAQAGAELSDLEFVQFHPTALAIGRDPMPLLTEALRGEGATLVNEAGLRYMKEEHTLAELAPRDVVARATWRQLQAGHKPMLDARASVGKDFAQKFPLIYEVCKSAGLDPAVDPLPIAPAAHYHMGGVKVDKNGRSTVDGLWACGEVACSHIHGANRLASNSLLEALVYGQIVAEDIASLATSPLTSPVSTLKANEDNPTQDILLRQNLRKKMYAAIGLVRDQTGMTSLLKDICALQARDDISRSLHAQLCVASMMAASALARQESRGAHCRSDYPASHETAVHSTMTLEKLQPAIHEWTGLSWDEKKNDSAI